jgi:ubiquinone/menaquinone biosynthesis C-methylase UbiE
VVGFKNKAADKARANNSEIEVTFIREYLDKTSNSGCYEETNFDSLDELASAKRKLKPILNFHKDPKTILSVGIGSGIELLALHELFKGRDVTIKGLDLSSMVISKAKAKLGRYNVFPEFIEGSAIDLPFNSCSIDILIESAILHEVYSYLPDGKKAWEKAISDVADRLSENGVFLLRDFSSPIEKVVELGFKSDFSRDFYKYFINRYRIFNRWNIDSSKIVDKRTKFSEDFPKMNDNGLIRISLTKTAEFMLHFKNFLENYSHNITEFGDDNWKEINETYLVPNPRKDGINPMAKDEYVEEVLNTANKTLRGSNYKLICLQSFQSGRPEIAKLLKKHFNIYDAKTGEKTDEYFNQITEKMELIFKKINISVSGKY